MFNFLKGETTTPAISAITNIKTEPVPAAGLSAVGLSADDVLLSNREVRNAVRLATGVRAGHPIIEHAKAVIARHRP